MKKSLAALLIVGALILSGCAAKMPEATNTPAATPTPAKAATIKVVTAFYALEYLAKEVGGDAVTVETLVAPGTEPHDLELTPKQISGLSAADLVVFQKGFQSAVDKAVTESKPKNVLDTASFLTFVEADDHDDHDGHADEHKDEANKDGHDEHGHDEHGHDHGKQDPHTWLDPQNMIAIAKKLGEQLTTINPALAPVVAQNTEKVVKMLTELDTEFTTGLKTCTTRTFITQHKAFSYLAKRYHLDQESIAGLDPEVEPTAARIKEIMSEAKENKVTTIFYETLVSDKVAKAIAKDLNLKTDVLDPLEGINEKSRGKDYVEVMKANLAALKTANGCQ